MKVNDASAAATLLDRIGRIFRTEEQVGDLYPAQWAALRYLARANRFSRTPMAMTRYLATTRGTMSQTINALERKGYVRRSPNERDKRSVNVDLTKAGAAKLKQDPLGLLTTEIESALANDAASLRGQLEAVLRQAIATNDGHMFGECRTCRYFEEGCGGTRAEPHRCGLLEVGLSDAASRDICVEHEFANGD